MDRSEDGNEGDHRGRRKGDSVWLADGWSGGEVLRYGSASQMPRDFGRMSFAMNMDERIQIMKDYGATFFEDVTQVK